MENWKFEISANKRKTVEVLHLFRWFTHTIFHTQCLSHTTLYHLSHTISHTQSLSHTIFVTHTIFHTQSLSHTALYHTIFHTQIFHTQLCHTHNLSHTNLSHNFVTHTIFNIQLCHTHTQLSHTIFFTHIFVRDTLRGKRGTWRHTCSNCVAGVALAYIDFRFAWQAWLCQRLSFTHNFVTH